MNEILLFSEIVIVFGLLLITKRLFGRNGLICWVAIASIIANIEVTKSVDIFNISGTLGNVMFASNFLATDILIECYGKKYARQAVFIGIFAVVVYIINMQISLLYVPNSIDIANTSMCHLFNLAPRICMASLMMFALSNIVDVYLFASFKNKFSDQKLWLRSNISTILCNCLENFGFVFIAFINIYPIEDLIAIAISTSIIEIILSLFATPFLYLAKYKIRNIRNEGGNCNMNN